MTETRIAPRCRFDKRAIAGYGGGKYPCTVRDISVTGAAISFSGPGQPSSFCERFQLDHQG